MRTLLIFSIFLISAFLALPLVSTASTEDTGTRSDDSYYDVEIIFEKIGLLRVNILHHLEGSDATLLRTTLDTNESYGNNNLKVDSSEVNNLVSDLEGDGADINLRVNIEIGQESYISGITQTVVITGAEGSVVQQDTKPIDFNTYVVMEMSVATDVPKYEMVLEITDQEIPRNFHLSMPDEFPMNITTFEPKAFTSYSNPYYINMTEQDTKDIGYLLLDPVRVEVINNGYVDTTPNPDDDVVPDDDTLDDDPDEDEKDSNIGLYIFGIGLGVVMLLVIVLIYRRSEKKEKELNDRDASEKRR